MRDAGKAGSAVDESGQRPSTFSSLAMQGKRLSFDVSAQEDSGNEKSSEALASSTSIAIPVANSRVDRQEIVMNECVESFCVSVDFQMSVLENGISGTGSVTEYEASVEKTEMSKHSEMETRHPHANTNLDPHNILNRDNLHAYCNMIVTQTDIYESLFEHVPIGILYQNNRGEIEHANPAAEKMLGAEFDVMKTANRENLPWDTYHRDGKTMTLDEYPGTICLRTSKPQHDFVIGIKRPSGEMVWINADSETVHDSSTGERTGVLTTFVDITKELNARDELNSLSQRTQMAVESAEMGVWDWVPGERNMIWDKKQYQLYGYSGQEQICSLEAWRKAIHQEDLDRVMRESKDLMRHGGQKNIDYRVVWPNGCIRHLRSQARVIQNAKGKVERVIGVTHDVTNAVMAERKLWELAYTDTLTGLYSRAGLNFRLSRSVARALKRDGRFCVITMGLSRFKEINENYGISVGDKILVEVANRAKEFIQENDTAARIGGDEFTFVLEGVTNDTELSAFVEKVRSQVLRPVFLSEGLVINLGASIGASVYPDDGGDTAEMQTNAGLAMQANRQQTDGQQSGISHTRYSRIMSDEVSRRFNLKYQLFNAVKEEEFQLYYQPIIDLSCHKVIGCEALIRWRDNDGKFVSPMEFIPVVEETGLICELGNWINFTAIKQWILWQQLVPDLKYISVNVSPRQLEQTNFVEELVEMVKLYNISPENLQLEITEGTFLRESIQEDGTLSKLAEYGFRLAIDDFGTGYSSLAYLKRFNVDVIKIDRSFIKDIETDKSDRDIVSAILAMNKKLGFKTLVEGVETDEQDKIVQELGCDSAQGYLYGKPTFADEFAETYIQPTQTKH